MTIFTFFLQNALLRYDTKKTTIDPFQLCGHGSYYWHTLAHAQLDWLNRIQSLMSTLATMWR